MTFATWTPSLGLGIELIDRQHQELFKRIGDLIEAMQSGKGPDQVAHLLEFLDRYVHFHFEAEEAEMARLRYPGFEKHHGEHLEFIRDLDRLKAEYLAEGPSAHFAIKVNNRVGLWLVSHVMRSDRALAAHAKRKG